MNKAIKMKTFKTQKKGERNREMNEENRKLGISISIYSIAFLFFKRKVDTYRFLQGN